MNPWTAVTGAIGRIFEGWVKVKVSKQEATSAYNLRALTGEQDWDLEAQRAAKSSWKDELLLGVWYSPMVVGWWEQIEHLNKITGVPETYWRFIGAKEWVSFMDTMPYWWWFGAFGILSATYGLRWYFNNQQFNVAKQFKKGP